MAESGRMLVLLLSGIVCLGVVCGFQWNILPDDYVYACVGSKVTFPWSFKVTNEEAVVSVNWIHDGALSSDMMATLVRQHFVPTSAYSARVQHVQNGGLVLEDLFTEDSGNYTVEVNVALSGGLFRSFRKSVTLQVAGGLMLEGDLKAEQNPSAWWDESSRQWLIRLTCGHFSFLGPPPVQLTWTTPGGQSQPSSGYESGCFYLSLPAPVMGGNYTCSIPPERLPDLCYKPHGDHHRSGPFSATVAVDEMKARLSLLEANQKTLREDRGQLLSNQNPLKVENAQLQERLERVERTHEQDMQNMTEMCQGIANNLKDQLSSMQSVQQSLMDTVEVLNKTHKWDLEASQDDGPADDVTTPSFSGPCRPNLHQTIDDAWRSTSVGSSELQCDKNLEAGWYRFFLNGENAVMPTECVEDNHCSTHAPQWLDLQGKNLPEVDREVEGRACAHWSDNCCNWQSPVTVHNCGSFFIYKLQPRDNCHLAYCVERQE